MKSYWIVTVAVSLFASSAPALGGQASRSVQPLEPPTDSPSEPALEELAHEHPWRFNLSAQLWAVGVDGDVGARGQTASVDASFLDVVEASDSLIGFAGRIEFGKGAWGGFVDGVYNRVGVEDASGPVGVAEVDVTLDMGLLDFGVMYRLGEWPKPDTGNPFARAITLDAYAGARYTVLNLELDPAMLDSTEREQAWLDPIVGAKVVAPISQHFHVAASGDIGGFGVSSDFTWSATAVLAWDFTLFGQPATLYGGYRALGQDFTDGSGANRFEWDAILHGPALGLEVSF